jgi:hypothetical protein
MEKPSGKNRKTIFVSDHDITPNSSWVPLDIQAGNIYKKVLGITTKYNSVRIIHMPKKVDITLGNLSI